MYCFEYGTRLDKFDYENLGMNEIWYLQDTIKMLISYEMEIKGYFEEANAETIYGKLYSKYKHYMSNCLFGHKFPFNPALHKDFVAQHGTSGYDYDRANFKRCDFISFLSNNNEPNVDIEKLQKTLSGEEVPGLIIATNQPKNTWYIITKDDIQKSNLLSLYMNDYEEDNQVQLEIKALPVTAPSYEPIRGVQQSDESLFVKTDKGWDLKFENIVLRNVKDWAGMSYIKILLENPGQKISVLKLQELTGTGEFDIQEGAESPPEEEHEGNIDSSEAGDKTTSKSSSNLWVASDRQAIQEYIEQINKIGEQLIVARASKFQNRSKIERLEKDKTAIEAMLNEANYKPKDPIVEKARKAVSNVIAETIKKIRKLEVLCNYNDKSISSHLGRYIKMGASCSYTAKDDNLPHWKFS